MFSSSNGCTRHERTTCEGIDSCNAFHPKCQARFGWQAIGGAQELWTWGCGKHGRLGHGGQENEDLPKKVEHFVVCVPGSEVCSDDSLAQVGSRVRSLSCGAYATAVVTQMGDLFVIGRENQATTLQGLYLPRHIPELRKVASYLSLLVCCIDDAGCRCARWHVVMDAI